MAQIELINVTKTFGRGNRQNTAVAALNYTIDDGHFVSLLGPSGCGKSTTLNMIAGLEDISTGEILIDRRRVDDVDPSKRDLAFVFQDYALYPHMNVYDNIAFGLKMRKVPKGLIDQRVHDAARRLDIDQLLTRKPRNLSGGQRQRVALARAIARRPAVFLFDEPLSNLDALLRDQTSSELKVLHADLGATSVYVTHDQEEAMTLSDRIAVMSRGHLEQYGTPYEVYHRPATEFVAGFVGKPRMNLLDAKHTARSTYRVSGSTLDLPVPDVTDDTIRLGLRPEQCTVHEAEQQPHGIVKVIEPLGNVSDVLIDLGEQSMTVRTPGFAPYQPGTPVRITIETDAAHAFSTSTGDRLN